VRKFIRLYFCVDSIRVSCTDGLGTYTDAYGHESHNIFKHEYSADLYKR
jgi:hypothetical protein